jgi:hypothetical protein
VQCALLSLSEMEGSLLLRVFLLLHIHLQASEACNEDYDVWKYSHLFSKLEEALISNRTVMNLLRQSFMITDSVEISFNVQLEIVNGTNLSNTCDNDYYSFDYEYFYPLRSFDTFCPSDSSNYHWKLCFLPDKYGCNNILLTFSSQTHSKREAERKRINTDVAISWLSLLHGNTLSSIFFNVIPNRGIYPYDDDDDDDYHIWVSMTLVMDTLDCNPPIPMTQCALSELLSWVCISCFKIA